MKENMQGPVYHDVGADTARNSDPVSVQDRNGTGSRREEHFRASPEKTPKSPSLLSRIGTWTAAVREDLFGDASDKGYAARRHAFQTKLRMWLSVIVTCLASLLFSGAALGYETYPLGLALVCAAGTPLALAASVLGQLLAVGNEAHILYLGGMTAAVGMRYAVGRFLAAEPDAFGAAHSRRRERRRDSAPAAVDDACGTLARIGRAIFPSGVFSQSIAERVGISVLGAAPIAIGYLLGDAAGMHEPAVRAVFVMASIPAFTYLFCGIFDRTACAPALREAGIGAVCFALTASCGGLMLFGFSVRQLCAHAITLYISRKQGYLRGAAAGLLCGFAVDALYAPAYALIGAAAGILWSVHPAPALLLSLAAGGCCAVYVGAFAAVRNVLPEMIVVSAVAYPIVRYLPSCALSGAVTAVLGGHTPACADRETAVPAALCASSLTPEILGIPSLAVQLDTLSGILMGLSSTFYHLSDRTRKPGLYEIRQLCEGTADRYCAHCTQHTLCWERDFSATADAMGRITLCIHRKGRAESAEAFAPLDRRCPHLPAMLAAMNDAAAHLCEEKMTKDKTETAAGDYEGMAKLLRASAEAYTKSCQRDAALSRRLSRAVHRIGFRAETVSVYGDRRRVVVADGIDLGGAPLGLHTGGAPLLGSEEIREAFSALSGVRYQTPEYHLTDGGRKLCMTMRAGPKLSVAGGTWGEKKEDEEVTGDVACLFANRSDCFYALVCDGMGSGREASVTAQISALFLEKLLSVSTAAGASLNLLNGFLRARPGECAATVDLCEIDMITGEARFIKCGAAASYLIRGGELFRITSGTVPLGILREISAEETKVSLCTEDLLLFFSDGVCGEDEDSGWIAETVRAAQKDYEARRHRQHIRKTALSDGAFDPDVTEALPSPMDALARALGEAAVRRIGRRDDMTVAVLKVRDLT